MRISPLVIIYHVIHSTEAFERFISAHTCHCPPPRPPTSRRPHHFLKMSFSTASCRSSSSWSTSYSLDCSTSYSSASSMLKPSPRTQRSLNQPNTADDLRKANTALRNSWISEIAGRINVYQKDTNDFIDTLVPCSTDHPFVSSANRLSTTVFQKYQPTTDGEPGSYSNLVCTLLVF